MFTAALDALGVTADEALFVDDNRKNCDAARALGMRTAMVCRDQVEYLFFHFFVKTHRVIRSLTELGD